MSIADEPCRDPPGETDPGPVYECDEALTVALALAKNCLYAVFPVGLNKLPTRPKNEGGRGLLDATTDLDAIRELWKWWAGPLVGVATGKVSNLDVLDIDAPRHSEARAWWRQHAHLFQRTRVYRTRSGGFHAYYQHGPGVRNSASKLARGVDTRGCGGFVVHWYSAGFECLDHAPPAPWPTWLTEAIWPLEKPQEAFQARTYSNDDGAIEGLLRVVREAKEGERNATLNWSAYKMRPLIARGVISSSAAQSMLLEAARSVGLKDFEAERTIASGLKGRAAA